MHDSRSLIRRSSTPLVMAVMVLAAGCSDTRDETASAIDSSLSRDLTLAASATPAVAIGDTAVTAPASPAPVPSPSAVSAPSPVPAPRPAPVAARPSPPSRPAPVTAAPAPRPSPVEAPVTTQAAASATVPQTGGNGGDGAGESGRRKALGAGVILSGATNAQICNLANRPGDRFVVSLGQAVTGPDGAGLPAGTPILVELAQASAEGDFSFRLKGVQLDGEFIPAEGTVRITEGPVTERKVSKGGSDQGKVITGAVIGGILGRVLGGGTRGAVIGAAGGAAAGTVAAARNSTTERCLSAGAILSTTLSAPLVFP